MKCYECACCTAELRAILFLLFVGYSGRERGFASLHQHGVHWPGCVLMKEDGIQWSCCSLADQVPARFRPGLWGV